MLNVHLRFSISLKFYNATIYALMLILHAVLYISYTVQHPEALFEGAGSLET